MQTSSCHQILILSGFFRRRRRQGSKAQFWFFTLCNVINKPHSKILIVICEIRQFRLHFCMVLSFAHWRFVLSKIRRSAYPVDLWDVFHVLLARTFVFGLRTNFLQKNFKTF